MAEDHADQSGVNSDPSTPQGGEPTQSNQPQSAPAQPSEPTAQSQPNAGSSDPSNINNDEGHSEDERAKAREAGKLQQIQNQFNRVAEWVAQDPDRLYDAYKTTSGMSEQEALEAVRQVHPNYQGSQSNQNQQLQQQPEYNQQVPTGGPQQAPNFNQMPQGAPQLSEHERAALAKMAAEEEKKSQERNAAISEFKDKYSNIDYTDKQAIVAMAIRFENKGSSPKEALDMAKTYVLEPEKLREEGEIEGMGRAYSQMSSARLGSGSGSDGSSGGASLSRTDNEVMRRLGLDKDDSKKEAFLNKVRGQ